MKEKRITVINSGRLHYTTTLTENLEYYCLIIDTEFLRKMGLDVREREFDDFIYDSGIEECFGIISRERKEKKTYSSGIIKGCVVCLATQLLRHYSHKTDEQKKIQKSNEVSNT